MKVEACILPLLQRSVTVELNAPLGNRTVTDGQGQHLPVQQGNELAFLPGVRGADRASGEHLAMSASGLETWSQLWSGSATGFEPDFSVTLVQSRTPHPTQRPCSPANSVPTEWDPTVVSTRHVTMANADGGTGEVIECSDGLILVRWNQEGEFLHLEAYQGAIMPNQVEVDELVATARTARFA